MKPVSRPSNPDRPGLPSRALIAVIDAYRVTLSPLLGGACRFTPSCSQYAREAILRHGGVRGIRLAAQRLLRCQPLARGGFDPVP